MTEHMSEQKQYYRRLGGDEVPAKGDYQVDAEFWLRPIEPTQWPEAQAFDKAGEPPDVPVLLFNQDSGIWTGWKMISHTNSTQYSHWMPMPPKPPAPAKPAWEVAYYAWRPPGQFPPSPLEAFKAAWELKGTK